MFTLVTETLVVWRTGTGGLLGPISPNPSQCFSEKPNLKGIKQRQRVKQSVSGFCSYVKIHKTTHAGTMSHTGRSHAHKQTHKLIFYDHTFGNFLLGS